jgi:glycosyltransferase involved in cell wall biosynthesis
VKKVLVDLGKLKDLNSGLGQVSMNFGQALALQSSSDLSLEYLVPENFQQQFGSNVSYCSLSTLRRWFPSLNKKYDAWHAIHQDSGFMPSSKVPYLLTVHDLNFMYEKSKSKALKRLDILKHKIDRAYHVSFISKFAQEEALKYLSLEGKSTSVIYNGVKAPDLNHVARPEKLPFDQFIFSIGVLRPKKNFLVLIEMMRHLEGYHLVIAGNDHHEYAAELRNAIAQHQLENRVVLLGSVSEQEKNYLYKHCSAFVFPSLYEGFGLPVIEAMHAGKPVFSSTCTSLPEIGKEYSVYWNSFEAEAMAHVFKNGMIAFYGDAQVNELRLKKHAATFSWKENVTAYLQLYQQA